jgi:hypothetical protein
MVLVQPSGTTSSAWSTSGTMIGVNAVSGFGGNLLDLQVNGTEVLKAAVNSGLTFQGNSGAGAFIHALAQISNTPSYFEASTIGLPHGDIYLGIESSAAHSFTGTLANEGYVVENTNTGLCLGNNATCYGHIAVTTGHLLWNTTTDAGSIFDVTGAITNSSGVGGGLVVAPTYNQTSTAAATDLLINRTETAVGSGAQLLLDLQKGSSSQFNIDHNGLITTKLAASSGVYTNSLGQLVTTAPSSLAISGATYATATNCSSSASPAVCGSAAAGAVAIPTGISSVSLTINTTAVTANSEIFLIPDDSVTIAATTCNSTLATLVGGVAVTARTPGTSFTVTYNGTIATNPLCLSYYLVN